MKKTLIIILSVLCIGCISAIFLLTDTYAAEVDYGLEIFGKAVTLSLIHI